uniref:Uncharacterized protein n=1 Tax=Populus trichocarpa TaxID=3694 RepID=A0A2K1Y0Y8_POPTR
MDQGVFCTTPLTVYLLKYPLFFTFSNPCFLLNVLGATANQNNTAIRKLAGKLSAIREHRLASTTSG